MLKISSSVSIPVSEIELAAIRAQGAGGQNVNKVSSAIHLRFDINNSSLPDSYKERLLATKDRRISKGGVIIIKAQKFRTQEKNRLDALARLQQFIIDSSRFTKTRIPTKATKASKTKRLESKSRRATTKALRKKVTEL